MYLPEIVALVCTTLHETQSWHLKAQAAAATATLAEKAGTGSVVLVHMAGWMGRCVCVCVCVRVVCKYACVVCTNEYMIRVGLGGWEWQSVLLSLGLTANAGIVSYSLRSYPAPGQHSTLARSVLNSHVLMASSCILAPYQFLSYSSSFQSSVNRLR